MTQLLYKITENGVTNIISDYQIARKCKENGAHVETFYREMTRAEVQELERNALNR